MIKKTTNQVSSIEASLYFNTKKNNSVFIYIIHQILVLAGVIGTVFTFLSCINIEYNKVYVLITAIISAFLFNIIFNLNSKYKKYIFASAMILFFAALFFYRNNAAEGIFNIANKYFSQVKSAYYDKLYYDFVNLETAYQSTQIFLVFAVIFIAIRISYGVNYRNIFAFFAVSLPPAELCLYWGLVPDYTAFILLIVCIVAMTAFNVSIPDSSNKKLYQRASAQCGISAAFIMLICFLGVIIYIKLTDFSKPDVIAEINKYAADYKSQNSMQDMLDDIKNVTTNKIIRSGAIDHGKLGKNDNITFSNQTVLQVTIPKSSKNIYLRGFVGEIYNGNSWTEFSYSQKNELDKLTDSFKTNNLNPLLFDSYNLSSIDRNSLPKYNCSVRNVSASKNYLYMPYNLVPESVSIYEIADGNYFKGNSSTTSYFSRFYDPSEYFGYTNILKQKWTPGNSELSDDEQLYRKFVYDNYLTLPDKFEAPNVIFNDDYYSFITAESGNTGKSTLSEVTVFSRKLYYIKKWLRNNCAYDLKAGKLPSEKDFADYFLLENKKGSCSHFATAAVLLCRYAGIPARYVEGYIIIASNDFSETTQLGVSETVNVTDARGHAWIEVYINGFGWYPVEVTSGYGNYQTAFTTTSKTTAEVTSDSDTDNLNATTAITEADTSEISAGTESIKESAVQQESVTESSSNISAETSVPEKNQITVTDNQSDAVTNHNNNPDFLKLILFAVICICLSIFFLLVRRLIVIRKLEKYAIGFGNNNLSAKHIYERFDRLLTYIQAPAKTQSMTYSEYIEMLSESFDYLSDGSAEIVINTALKAFFDENLISDDELNQMYSHVNNAVLSCYNSSGWAKKLYIKYVLAFV